MNSYRGQEQFDRIRGQRLRLTGGHHRTPESFALHWKARRDSVPSAVRRELLGAGRHEAADGAYQEGFRSFGLFETSSVMNGTIRAPRRRG